MMDTDVPVESLGRRASDEFSVQGTLVDLFGRRLVPATVFIADGRIAAITKEPRGRMTGPFILPGFVDAHVHIESSMLVPAEFGRMAVPHGTVATVSDPHEIANVAGRAGIESMIESAGGSPLKVFFGVPSCVPATPFESAGAVLDAEDVGSLIDDPRLGYLSEMMNYPGVVNGDEDVHRKLQAARRAGKPIDGHAIGLTGLALERYVAAGITTDHECTTESAARERIALGMQVQIREGSAARNFDALIGLLPEFPDAISFCSDDKHPDDLQVGHIDRLVQRALALGIDRFTVLRAACVNPVRHYGLPVGLLRVGDPADFLLVDDPDEMTVARVYLGGIPVAERGTALFPHQAATILNNFSRQPLDRDALVLRCESRDALARVIVVEDGLITTGSTVARLPVVDGGLQGDPAQDILKLVVVNRYREAPVSVGFVKGLGLTRGALASSIAHDSHNVVAAGVSDDEIVRAVNRVIEARGGIAFVAGPENMLLPLPVGGLMSTECGEEVSRRYTELDRLARECGSRLRAPFMTLSFLSLLVIPSLKLGDRGLFDVDRFEFVPVIVG